MIYDQFYNTETHSYSEYEQSHGTRLDFLVEDLKLNDSPGDTKIADIGCGIGFIYNRLLKDIQQNYYGYDGFGFEESEFRYYKVDLDNFTTGKLKFFDVILCFETLEHLCNPYNCLYQIKEMIKDDGIIYISIPEVKTCHNTIYPGLFYPVDNFIQFINQMAFEILDHRIHNKCFSQHVFTLKSLDWSNSKMLWHRQEDKFRNIPPHISVNL